MRNLKFLIGWKKKFFFFKKREQTLIWILKWLSFDSQTVALVWKINKQKIKIKINFNCSLFFSFFLSMSNIEMDFSASDDSDTSDLDTSYQVRELCWFLGFLGSVLSQLKCTFAVFVIAIQKERSTNGLPVCRGCTNEINEKYYLRVNQTSWHEECLKCNICNVNLEKEETCFVKKKQILCKIDYYK